MSYNSNGLYNDDTDDGYEEIQKPKQTSDEPWYVNGQTSDNKKSGQGKKFVKMFASIIASIAAAGILIAIVVIAIANVSALYDG